MRYRVKVMPPRNPCPEFNHFVGREFHDPPASPTDHVVVRLLAEYQLVVRLFHVETDLLQNAAGHENRQGSVHRRLADAVPLFAQQIDELLGLEVFVQLQNGIKDRLPRLRVLYPVILEVLDERTSKLLGVKRWVAVWHDRH